MCQQCQCKRQGNSINGAIAFFKERKGASPLSCPVLPIIGNYTCTQTSFWFGAHLPSEGRSRSDKTPRDSATISRCVLFRGSCPAAHEAPFSHGTHLIALRVTSRVTVRLQYPVTSLFGVACVSPTLRNRASSRVVHNSHHGQMGLRWARK
jgi:hypothetical protein